MAHELTPTNGEIFILHDLSLLKNSMSSLTLEEVLFMLKLCIGFLIRIFKEKKKMLNQ